MPFTIDPGPHPYVETTIKKSRFVARLRRVDSEDDVDALLALARKEHPGASHHCFAYLIGDEPERRIERSGDDGEPGGTAGAPMLNALKGRDLVNVAAVVSRYFGGVKLGAGGLVRAYSGAVTAAIDAVQLRPRVRWELLRLRVSHADAGWVEAQLRRRFDVVDVDYGESTIVTVATTDVAQLRSSIAEMLSGGGDLTACGHLWR